MTQIIGLSHIGVYTKDITISIKFYQEFLGFRLEYTKNLVKEDGTTKLAFLEAGNCIIELIQPSKLGLVDQRTAGIVDHVALSVADIDAVISNLKAAGVVFETETATTVALKNGAKNVFFSGPSGERIELFEWL